MSSPAEPSRAPDVPALSQFQQFRAGYDFDLDPFQIEGCRALEAGDSVLVAAPTGSGKTVVGEFAVHLALAEGNKCFYTTPIKALSNQKFTDLVARHGADKVGLLTGDNTVNGEAPIVVMTTEVLRNMLYAGSGTLSGLGYVVMDEVHYLADRFRGAVWEEVIIHLPESVRLVALSATVSNVEEFAGWLRTVRGDTETVVWEHRPVPLWQHVLAGKRMYDLFANGSDGEVAVGANGQGGPRAARELRVNPELVRLNRDGSEAMYQRGGLKGNTKRGGRGRRPGGRGWVPSRVDVIEKLDSEGLLPAITFIFSRAGCDAAVQQFLHAGVRLLNSDERARVKAHVLERTARIPSEDLHVLGFHDWFDGLQRGVAAHHAGMLPTFKEIVEELFVQGLVKAVFATETLALGINMPARTVVLEALTKWNGENHVDLTAGEYTQLTGRAGRRGIDIEGHAVVLWRPDLDAKALAGLAGTRTYPLCSSFKPSYNMAVNLVGQFGRERARNLLETSFAQYQADQAVVGLTRQVRKNEAALDGYAEAITCHLGDFEEYMKLRRELSEREAELSRQGAANRRAAALAALERLSPGDIIVVPSGKRAGLAVVLDPGIGAVTAGRAGKQLAGDGPRPVVLTADRQVVRLSLTDFPSPAEPLDRLRIPKSFNAKSAQSRRDLATALRNKAGDKDIPPYRKTRYRSDAADDTEIARLRKAIRSHPCHGCQDREDHARWAERHHKLSRETQQIERRVAGRTNSIARVFDRVCALLGDLGYLDADEVTTLGRRLGRLYTELDLLTAETLRAGLWEGLTPAELAASVSPLVYEARRADDAGPPRLPGGTVPKVLEQTVRLWARLDELETDHQLDFQREPDLGFAWPAYMWAAGKPLEEVLWEVEMPAGDFVRWCKQLIDLLGQIANAAAELGTRDGKPSTVRGAAHEAIDAMRRGVVAYSMMNG